MIEITRSFLLQGKNGLSTHEKELENLKSKIEQMEKANLEPKDWTMQGEASLIFFSGVSV